MKALILSIFLQPQFVFAHKEHSACKKIHDACTEANLTGKAGWKCSHTLMKGEKLDVIKVDLSSAVKECHAAKEAHKKEEAETDSAPASQDH